MAGDETPGLALKKLGGILLLPFSFLLLGVGFYYGSKETIALGVLLLAVALGLLALKIVRRNQRGGV